MNVAVLIRSRIVPTLDHREDGWAAVVITCVAITALFVALLGALSLLDRRSPTGSHERQPA